LGFDKSGKRKSNISGEKKTMMSRGRGEEERVDFATIRGGKRNQKLVCSRTPHKREDLPRLSHSGAKGRILLVAKGRRQKSRGKEKKGKEKRCLKKGVPTVITEAMTHQKGGKKEGGC